MKKIICLCVSILLLGVVHGQGGMTIPITVKSNGVVVGIVNSLNFSNVNIVNGVVQFGRLATMDTVEGTGGSKFVITNAIYTSTNIYTYVNTGEVFRVVLTNNAILMNPSNSVDGKAITWWIKQDSVGERTIDLGTHFKIPSSASLPLSWATNANGMTMFAARYDSVYTNWYVLSLVPGY